MRTRAAILYTHTRQVLTHSTLLSGQIQQSTPSATAANSLNVSQLRVNVDVDAAFLPTLTLSGLTGSQSADTDALGVGRSHSEVFKSTAVWRRNAGDAPREREIGHAYTRTLYARAQTHTHTHTHTLSLSLSLSL